MFRKILFPTDFSERAEVLLDCIAGIPGVREVILLHVVRETRHPMGAPGVDALARKNADEMLAMARSYLASLNPGITVTMETTIAPDIAGGILAAAEKWGAGLIVISAHQANVAAGILFGSVASMLMCRVSEANVLVMRHKIIEGLTGKTYEKFCPRIFSRILCPTDFSRFSEHATALAGTTGGELILLHVVPGCGTLGEMREAVEEAESRAGAACDSLAAQGVRCRAIVKTGDPATGILETAEEQDVSVIWISSYGKGCLQDLLLGSTVQYVAVNATRPVIIIRSWG